MRFLPVLCALLFSGAAESATLYVDPSHGKSVNSGAGSATAPYKTISYAIRQLVSGDRLIIAPGTYRETLQPKWKAQNLVIEGSAGTVIKGSDVVTGWKSAGGGVFVRPNWTVNSQQVHVNGVAYQQIGGTISSKWPAGVWPGRVAGSRSSMTPNSFYYDSGAKSLYVKPSDGSLSGKTVEVSVRERIGLGAELNNVQLRNLTFMHANTSATTNGASVLFMGNRLTLDRITILRADAFCLAVVGDNNTISNSVANYCGVIGMSVRGRYVKLINNETSYNNTRGFSQDWGASGMKNIGPGGTSPGGLKDSLIQGHRALYNNGEGIWLDTNPGGGNKIIDSIAAYNGRYGIHFEISDGAEISNNLVFGNKSRGIYVAGSSNAIVANNLVVKNGLENISVSNSRNSTGSSRPNFLPRNNKVIGNITGWPTKDSIRIPDKSYNPESNGNLILAEKPSVFAQERNGSYALRSTGLPQWQRNSDEDRGSSEKIMGMPSNIAAGLNAKQVNLDWSVVKNAASAQRSSAGPTSSMLSASAWQSDDLAAAPPSTIPSPPATAANNPAGPARSALPAANSSPTFSPTVASPFPSSSPAAAMHVAVTTTQSPGAAVNTPVAPATTWHFGLPIAPAHTSPWHFGLPGTGNYPNYPTFDRFGIPMTNSSTWRSTSPF